MDAARRNQVAWERLPSHAVGRSGRIVESQAANPAEIAVSPSLNRDRVELRGRLMLNSSLKGTEEKRLVLADRPSRGATKLIADESRLGLRNKIEEIARADGRVPMELE